jgi:Fe-S cluster assembly protein SufD
MPLPAGAFQTLREAIVSQPAVARAVLEKDFGAGPRLDSLGAALAGDGAILHLTEGEPVVVLDHRTTSIGDSDHVRHSVVVAKDCHATLVDLNEQEAGRLAHTGLRIEVEAGGKLDHIKLIAQAGGAHLGGIAAHLGAGADYELNIVMLGTALVRQSVEIGLEGEGARARIRGALLVAGEEHLDLHARIEHGVPRCTSETQVRAVAARRGRAAVQSLVRVAPGARGSDARQMIRGLILSPKAEIDAKPELEILNDDVKCSHGTALGDLDPESIFYLRSRGVPEAQARALLTEAFISEILNGVAHAGARDLLRSKAQDWLAQAFGGGDG